MSRWNSRRCSRRGGRTVEEYEVVQVVEPVEGEVEHFEMDK